MTQPLRLGIVTVIVWWAAVAPAPAQLPAEALAQGAGPNGPYTPPACVPGVPFSDITCGTGFDPWIEQFALDGITAGCGGGNYCPGSPVTRDQMAVFIEKAMRGTAGWPPHTQLVWAVRNSDGTPNPTASGTALLTAVAAIPTSGNDTPSATNPWLLRIGPGIYDLGAGALQMKSYVDVEGSGTGATIVTAAGSASVTTGTVVGANNAELRSLTVRNTGGAGTVATGVFCNGTSPNLRNVAIVVTNDSSDYAFGFYGIGYGGSLTDVSVRHTDTPYSVWGVQFISASNATASRLSVQITDTSNQAVGVYVQNSQLTMEGSNVTVGGGNIGADADGVINAGSYVTISNTVISLPPSAAGNKNAVDNSNGTTALLTAVTAGGSNTAGVNNETGAAGLVTIDHCVLDSVVNNGAYSVYAGASRIGFASKPGGGTFTCTGNYDFNYNPLSCP